MLISTAWAADAATTTAQEPNLLVSLFPLLLVFLIFYFLIMRPQNKRIAEHRRMVENLRRCDKVVTGGGLIATVKKVNSDDELQVELSDGVLVTVVRSTIMSIRNKVTTPANDGDKKPSGKKSSKK